MKSKNIVNSFKYAIMGILSSLKSERNMKVHFFFVVAVVVLGFIYKISLNEWIFCLICFAFVITAEMINTAIEIVTDLAMPKINEKAKLAKDISAGAVLVSAIISIIVGLIIFIPKVFNC